MFPFWGHDAEISQWVAAQLGETGFGNCRAMGVMDADGELAAGVVYHGWNSDGGVIQMSAASLTAKWLTRPVLWEMFAAPFDRMGIQLCVLRVGERNETWNGRGIQRILRAYGFNSYRIPRLRGRDEAEILFTLADDDWRQSKFHRQNEG